jgi:signal transduction histidine kinase
VYGLQGRWKGHCVRISDQTAQKDAERRQRQADRLESVADLARSVSGQFQAAFELVHNNASLLLADPDCEATSERKLARIVEAATYGSELANELRLYTGSVTTQRVVLELSEIVDECCQLIEDDLPAAVRVVRSPSEEPLPVYVDAIQLRHCIFSVLMHAIDAMAHASGEIRVETGPCWLDPGGARLVWGADQPAGDYAYVRIRDEGGGLDRETEERAFEPYLSKRPEERGTGLPTALGIARAHHAPLALENESGLGCEVTIYFPLDRAHPRPPRRPGTPRTAGS